jgi:hypothetical protein
MSLFIEKNKPGPDDFCLVCKAKLGFNPAVPNGQSICLECLEHVQSADKAISVQMSKTPSEWLKNIKND